MKVIPVNNEVLNIQGPLMEFHISRKVRDTCQFNEGLFASTGNVILANFKAVKVFTHKINTIIDPILHPESVIKSGQLNAMGLIDEIFHYVCRMYRKEKNAQVFHQALAALESDIGTKEVTALLKIFITEFPPLAVYQGRISEDEYLAGVDSDGYPNRVSTLEELMLLKLANENPACKPFYILYNDTKLQSLLQYQKAWDTLKDFFAAQPSFGPDNQDLITMLKAPVVFSPLSLKGQLDYIRTHWANLLGEWLLRLLAGVDFIQEEEKPGWSGGLSGPPVMDPYTYNHESLMKEYERFSPDRDWMPRVTLMAKTVLVWLNQLADKYDRPITRLDHIPDEELDILAQQGFNGLWLIGLWERSHASKRIKQINGNPEAAASAYSLHDYDIAQELGGWEALEELRRRLWYRGIRLASDMVPNHTGMDSKWLVEKPDLFIQTRDCPFPSYTFNGENLSIDGRVSVFLEDKYYSKNDCAVVYKRVDNYSGDVRYIYHGNDGTGMPWNDTAQIDFLNPIAREEVIQKILLVARNFPIIRFDAAMVLAKKHIQRLWYPEPGHGGDIASRAESAISFNEFQQRIPEEFWREVVDRCAREVPDTLLLAEAFWMMEGYFVRTLGMHRVYNSAFMNMLKREENDKYRATIKNTLEFDPQILKRFVNFMNNPDEETAVAQFGKGDKYFGVCTLMITMPGLPMFGHGQVEGFEEKYGMEFTKAYWKETPDQNLVERHRREIFPLMKKRFLFAEIENFYLYDVWNNGSVNENVYAYSNSFNGEKSIVFYNNVYNQATGWIKTSTTYAVKTSSDSKELQQKNLAEALELSNNHNAFCVFQEHRSGLWYIRSSEEIHRDGLFVALNGFETQVLLNIHELHDDETGKYRILFEYLNGKGVPDIMIAMQELFLKDLYRAFLKFASKDFFTAVSQLFAPTAHSPEKKVLSGDDVLKAVKESGMLFFDTLTQFIAGNYGSSTLFDLNTVGPEVPTEEAWSRFALRFNKLLKIKEYADKAPKTLSKDAISLLSDVYEVVLSRPFMAETLLGFLMLYSIRDIIGDKATAEDTQSLINMWCLDRKLRDALADYGVATHNSAEPIKGLLTVLPYIDNPLCTSNTKEVAHTLLKSLIEDKAAGEVLGVNLYDTVLWFNAEKAQSTVWLAVMCFVLFGESRTTGDAKKARSQAPKTQTKKAVPEIYATHEFSEQQWSAELTALKAVQACIADAQEKAAYKAQDFVTLLETEDASKKKTTQTSSTPKSAHEAKSDSKKK